MMKVLFYGHKRGVIRSERQFRKEIIYRTPGVEVYPYGVGYFENEINRKTITEVVESLGGVDVFLASVQRRIYKKECFDALKALKVSVAPDFYEGAYKIGRCRKHYRLFRFDIVFGSSTIVMDYLKKEGVSENIYHLPYGVRTDLFKKYNVEKDIDVLASYLTESVMPDVYPYRVKMQEILAAMPISLYMTRIRFHNLPEFINRSRIVVNSNARYNFVNPRVTETLSCGSFLLTSYCNDLAVLGYKEGEHLVTFHNMEDFKDKILYFLEHDKEREEIASNGMKFVRENYSNKRRVEEMFDKIRKHL